MQIAAKVADKDARKELLEALLSLGCDGDTVDFFGNDNMGRSPSMAKDMTDLLAAADPARVPNDHVKADAL